MRPYDCVLVRVGEIALKSKQIRKKFFKVLLWNIKASLKGIDYKIERNPNRIFIYSKEVKKVISRLKKVFGITSISPCWTCYSGINEIKLLVADVATEHLALSKTDSFAVRVRRSGIHSFSSQTIAEEAGAAIKRVTGSNVNLTKPDHQIFIEIRSKKTYVFTEKIKCLGGMPVGTAGYVVCPLESRDSFAAAWLMMKRGCGIIAVVQEDTDKKPIRKLKKFGMRMKAYSIASGEALYKICDKLCETTNSSGIVLAENYEKTKVSDIAAKDRNIKNPVYRPLFFMKSAEIEKISKKFSPVSFSGKKIPYKENIKSLKKLKI